MKHVGNETHLHIKDKTMDFDQTLGELQRKVAQSQEGVGRRKLIYESLGVESGQSILALGCGGG